MKKTFLILAVLTTSLLSFEQKEKEKNKDEEEEKEKTPFRENLFTGGSVSLAFYNNTFLIGASPGFVYCLTNWIDAGVVVNYNYTSYRDYTEYNDRLRQ